MANGPDVQRIKKQKRDKAVEPAPAGMTRRRFLTYLGAGSAALTAASTGVLAGCAEGQQGEGASNGSSGSAAQGNAGSGEPSFRPIEPSDADELVLPEGYRYDIVRKWGDEVAPGAPYGYNNDYVAYFPIDVLDGGDSSEDGLLWVNHEYPDAKWVSDYRDPDSETKKTLEQIALEKTSVGGSVFRVRKEGDRWAFAEDDRYNRRVDATTPMEVTGPAAGSREVGGPGSSSARSPTAAAVSRRGTRF